MKTFVLSIFIIVAIIMAQLPSILGCGRGSGVPYDNGKRSVGSKGKLKSTLFSHKRQILSFHLLLMLGTGGDLLGFEMEGFSVCNTDGINALTFDEIMECKVCYKNILGQMCNAENIVISGPFW